MNKCLTLILLFFVSINSFSAITPPAAIPPVIPAKQVTAPTLVFPDISTMKIKEVQQLLGRKMKLKEKIAFKVFQWKLKKGFVVKKEEGKKDKGKTAMILGIIGLASLLIPYLSIIAIPCMILALVFGYQAKKENPDDSKAKTAIILGWIGIGLIVLALILVIAILASLGGWGWG